LAKHGVAMNIDVFNGDADGICALLQLRLAYPAESMLVSGVKRDIGLLDRVSAKAGDKLSVLDVSLDSNRQALLALLEKRVEVFYVDHHYPGRIPDHPCLTALINTDADVCSSLLMDDYLNHRFTAWAVTAAFGDNLDDSAVRAAEHLSLSSSQLQQLRQLGICINYNAYGSSVDDLYFAPEALYRQLADYASPFDFIREKADIYQQLRDGYADDMRRAWQIKAEYQSETVAVYILPDEKWARRVSGVWSNELANRNPDRAHAVLSHNASGGYQVSVRSSLNNKTGADELCARFPGGGGRKAAAGINHLQKELLADFIKAFDEKYRRIC
jgi:single-stranded DNA-specific DHH superfamily exonuclease